MLELSYLSKKNKEWSQHFQLYCYSFCNITASWLLFCWCFHLMTNNFRISLLALLSRRPYPSSEIFFLCQGTFPIWKEIQSHQAFSLHPTASHQYQDLPWHSFIQLLSHYSDWLGLWSPLGAFFFSNILDIVSILLPEDVKTLLQFSVCRVPYFLDHKIFNCA